MNLGLADVPYNGYVPILDVQDEIGSVWLDMTYVDKYQVTARASSPGMTLRIESRSNTLQPPLVTDTKYDAGVFFMINLITRDTKMKFTWINTTGSQVTDAGMFIKRYYGSSDKLSVFPVSVTPSKFSQAALVQSILRGVDADGNFQQVSVNSSGELVTADPYLQLLRGKSIGRYYYNQSGTVKELKAGDAGDIYCGSSDIYPGFDVTSAANISIVSTKKSDAGTQRESGTATGGTSTTLEDTGKDFVAAGVTAGDMLVNTTQMVHGLVTAVTSTTITVSNMMGDVEVTYTNAASDTYFIVHAADTGAALIRVSKLIDANYNGYMSEYIVMNGKTPVTTSGTYLRCSKARVVLAGSDGKNEGKITGTISGTEMFQIADNGVNQTQMMLDTVPAGKWLYIQDVALSMQRSNGSEGSATVEFRVRHRGEVFVSEVYSDLTTSKGYYSTNVKSAAIPPMSDFRWSYKEISDKSTTLSAEIAGVMITYP